MNWKQIGKFKVERTFITNLPITELRKVFKDIIVVEVENHYHKDTMVFTAIGKVFDEVNVSGMAIPEYTVTITANEAKTFKSKSRGRFQVIEKVEFEKR